jgi:hypothetical protein
MIKSNIMSPLRRLFRFLLGASFGMMANGDPSEPVPRVPSDETTSALREREDLLFLVQIAERAGDRVLNDIRSFNAGRNSRTWRTISVSKH